MIRVEALVGVDAPFDHRLAETIETLKIWSVSVLLIP